jgi:molecular chaperone DnaK
MRNTKVPHKVSKVFTTSIDYQEQVKIRVFQGENRNASQNALMGEFVLTGIRQALRREPQIEVSFRVDANGILHVSAVDLDTGESQSIVIEDYAERAMAEFERVGGGAAGDDYDEFDQTGRGDESFSLGS